MTECLERVDVSGLWIWQLRCVGLDMLQTLKLSAAVL